MTRDGPTVGAPDSSDERAFHLAPTGLAIFDADGVFVRVNPALCRLLGTPAEDLIGRCVADLAGTAEREERARRWIAAGGGGLPPPVRRREVEHACPDGSRPWLIVEAVPITGENGEERFGLMLVQDGTAAKELERALRRSHEKLDALVRRAPVAIYEVDPDGRVLLWNPGAEQMFGWTASEAIGSILPIVTDEHRAEFAAFRSQILDGRVLTGTEVERRRKDGSAIQIGLWTAPMRDDEGAPVGILAVAVDVTSRVEADRELRANAHRFRALVQNISDTVTIVDADGHVRFTTGQETTTLGYPTSWWRDRNLFDLADVEELPRARRMLEFLASQPGGEVSGEFRARHAAGHWEYLQITGVNLLDDPDVAGLVLTTRNVTESTRSRLLLAAQARILELIARGAALEETIGAINEMIVEHAEDGTSATFLLEGERLVPRGHHRIPSSLAHHIGSQISVVGSPFGDALGTGEMVVVTDVSTDPLVAASREILDSAGFEALWVLPIVLRGSGRRRGAIATFYRTHHEPTPEERRTAELASDLVAIALERFETESRLAHQALHDDLTGLPNRVLLLDRLEHALIRARQFEEQIGVLFVDLDRFKVVNDSLGHGAGDQLLIAFAERLRTIVRPDDTIARFGGDEFVVLSELPDGPRIMLAIAERLEQIMTEPFVLDDGVEVFLTASMGLAVGSAVEPEAMLRNADAAMYRAKDRGRNRLEVFDDEMRAAAVARLNLGNDLRRAMEREEFIVLHQPVVDVANGAIVGAEALVRWAHPTRGLVKPGQFISVTEETGMVVPLGEFVLDTALADVRRWAGHVELDGFTVSVNLSARQLSSPVLTSRVAEMLDRHRWPAERLCLELTESVLMADIEISLESLLRLKDLGIKLAIDDFGTGYSSLTYLQRLPVDLVKIDQSFVAGLSVNARRDKDDRGTIATAVVGMAHALGLLASAEGVEDTEQLAVLGALGCDLAQGYLFSEPVSANAFASLIEASPSPYGSLLRSV